MKSVAVEVINRQRRLPIDAQLVTTLVDAILAAVERRSESLTVIFVRDRAMRALNYRFRGVNHATDVLSFPMQDEARDERRDPNDEGGFLGDVVVSVDRAQRQAVEAGLTLDRELRELVMHGVLHLCGYDHETDRGEMNRLELRLRKKLLSDE